jgi:hypothetical protein
MPNDKYNKFKQQINKEFELGKTPKVVITEYNLKSRPHQDLPTRNIIYAWYKEYLLQKPQNTQKALPKQDLQSVNIEDKQTLKRPWWDEKKESEAHVAEKKRWWDKEVEW